MVWVLFDPKTLELGPFLWFRGKNGEGLRHLDNYWVGRHTKANSEGIKVERPGIRVLKRSNFPLAALADLANALFGDFPVSAPTHPTDRDRLERLGSFAGRLRDPSASFGAWVPATGKGPPDEPYGQPYFALSEFGSEFVHTTYAMGLVLGQFDWASWAKGQRGRNLLNDPGALGEATPEELAKLLTVVMRQDRFVEGGAEGQFKSGLLLRTAERAQALAKPDRHPAYLGERCRCLLATGQPIDLLGTLSV